MTGIRQLITALILAAGLPAAAAAQGTSITLGSLEQDTSLPVEVVSDSLRIENETGVALFSGNVVVTQGQMRLSAGEIRVEYSGQQPGSGAISRMVASDGVTFASGGDAAEAREAVYSPEAGTLEMSGDVILTQGPSAISGQRLVVDLGAGTGVMEGRVRTVFQTGNN